MLQNDKTEASGEEPIAQLESEVTIMCSNNEGYSPLSGRYALSSLTMSLIKFKTHQDVQLSLYSLYNFVNL